MTSYDLLNNLRIVPSGRRFACAISTVEFIKIARRRQSNLPLDTSWDVTILMTTRLCQRPRARDRLPQPHGTLHYRSAMAGYNYGGVLSGPEMSPGHNTALSPPHFTLWSRSSGSVVFILENGISSPSIRTKYSRGKGLLQGGIVEKLVAARTSGEMERTRAWMRIPATPLNTCRVVAKPDRRLEENAARSVVSSV